MEKLPPLLFLVLPDLVGEREREEEMYSESERNKNEGAMRGQITGERVDLGCVPTHEKQCLSTPGHSYTKTP